jgi:glycosyltransferase involved in cell wall biosynthesis
MSPRSPTVTVIIPTYNRSTVLPYSIGSVLWQTFADFELLVVGDGCTDDSEEVVRRVNDPRVRWINLPANTGHQSEPNNEGLRQARGDVIAYLGHDDLWLPHHLSCMLRGLEAGFDLAYSVTALVGPDGNLMEPLSPLGFFQSGMWLPPTGVVHRRSVIEHVGGWRNYQELECDPEIDLWQRAFEAGHKFAFVLRLTAVKFPAIVRRDVYKTRPHHEQAAWFERIQTEPPVEAVELARMLSVVQQAAWRTRGGDENSASPPAAPRKGDLIRARRSFKGLAPDP